MQHHEQQVSTASPPVPPGPLYFVGIGGAGMSALAQVLAGRGRQVAGGDPGIQPAVRARLEAAGVRVHDRHDGAQARGCRRRHRLRRDPAGQPGGPRRARKGLPVLRRPESAGRADGQGRGVAIAGTHGKTTTTGMVAHILLAAGLDPTIFLGGDLPAIGGNARAGNSDITLAEACEAYDGFLYMHGDEAHLIASFERFVGQTAPGGFVILCADDARARALASSVPAGVTTIAYGTGGRADVRAAGVDAATPHPAFTLERDGGQPGRVTLRVPGVHNVRNALAAAAVGMALGVPDGKIVAGLEAFAGTGRRFETIGEANGVLVIDDYAHHPTELRATLAAARAAYPERRLVAVFQPHLPSRTRDLMDEFADALAGADAVYLTDIYLAREKPLPGVTSEALARRVAALAPALPPVAYVPDKRDLPARLTAEVRPGDLVLTLGAGDIRAAGVGLLPTPPSPGGTAQGG